MKKVSYKVEFKAMAVKQVIERDHGVVEVYSRLGASDKSLSLWVTQAKERQGAVTDRALTAQSVRLIVRGLAQKVIVGDAWKTISAHSLRAGFLTEAAATGVTTSAFMGQTRHSSYDMVMRYVRPVSKWQIRSLL